MVPKSNILFSQQYSKNFIMLESMKHMRLHLELLAPFETAK